MKKYPLVLTLFLLTSCLHGEGEPYLWQKRKAKAQNSIEKGFVNFMDYDFGALRGEGLQRSGVLPWKVSMEAIKFSKGLKSDSALKKRLTDLGFLFPRSVMNAPKGVKKVKLLKNTPVGIVRGQIDLKALGFPLSKVDSAVLGCATCHSSHGYKSDGSPDLSKLWVGGSSSSFNPEGFANELYTSYLAVTKKKSAFIAHMKKTHPDAPETQGKFLKRFLNQIETGLDDLKELDRGTIHHNGGPGYTNGVASFKNYIGAYPSEQFLFEKDRAYTSIPVAFDRHMRTSLLVDGTYAAKGKKRFAAVSASNPYLSNKRLGQIAAFFTIPTSDNSAEEAVKSFKQTEEVMNFIAVAKREKFPGSLDKNLLQAGQRLYKKTCQTCHGTYTDSLSAPKISSFPNKLISLKDIGTDPVRAWAIDSRFIRKIGLTVQADYVSVKNTGGYVAPLLSQVWKTAPYLHNGSVPSLAALVGLEKRPQKFYIGGHKLDFKKMGIAGRINSKGLYVYPRGYRAWSKPSVYNTNLRGQSNKGHEAEFSHLNTLEKRAVLEYLKVL